jgi:hypothetical protein
MFLRLGSVIDVASSPPPFHPSFSFNIPPPTRLQKGESLQGVRRRRRKAIDSLREKTQVLLLLPVGRDTSLGPDSRNWPGYPTTTTYESMDEFHKIQPSRRKRRKKKENKSSV